MVLGELDRGEQMGASAVWCIGSPVRHNDGKIQRRCGACEGLEYASLVRAHTVPEKHNRLRPGRHLGPPRPVDISAHRQAPRPRPAG